MSEGPSKSTSNGWTHAILPNPCGGDANIFFWGCCCFPCLTCSNSRHLAAFPVSIFKTSDKTPSDRKVLCNMYCLLVFFCNPVATFLLRQTTREKYGIDGSDAEDAVSWMVNVRWLKWRNMLIRFAPSSVTAVSTARLLRRSWQGTARAQSAKMMLECWNGANW